MQTPLHSMREPLPTALEGLLDRVQANILQPHGRDHAVLLFLHFDTDVELRPWLAKMSSSVTTAADQLAASRYYAGIPRRGTSLTTLSLSWNGYLALGLTNPGVFAETGDDGRLDNPFVQGMHARTLLRKDPSVADWTEDLRGIVDGPNTIHALVLVADSDWSDLTDRVSRLVSALPPSARVVARREGHALKRNGKHIEHFGFQDGLSQPRFLETDVDDMNQTRGWRSGFGPSLVLRPDPYGPDSKQDCGSMLVFRDLAQDVDGFLASERAVAALLSATTPSELARIESLIVGRTRDGVPMVRSPQTSGNGFDFSDDLELPLLCPAHAHIRKANPRFDIRIGDKTRERVIARRSISYGVDPSSLRALPSGAERGMLFMCYQRSIARQFEFIQGHWLDDENFPFPETGSDPVSATEGLSTITWDRRVGNDPAKQRKFGHHVTLRGGGYFFTPSPSFLSNLP